MLGLEVGNKFSITFSGRVSLQSKSRNVSMMNIDEGIPLEEVHDDTFRGQLQTQICGGLKLRNIEERGINLAARLGSMERQIKHLQTNVSAGLQDIRNDIRDTVGLVQLYARWIRHMQWMYKNVDATGRSNLRRLRVLKTKIDTDDYCWCNEEENDSTDRKIMAKSKEGTIHDENVTESEKIPQVAPNENTNGRKAAEDNLRLKLQY
ncbi:hypothetical protein DFS33DRAFT_1455945 [Desarmillaria ectypa]|nr:hypothetical protein DFS33DRAFT_1455945 [Desarmillaria ectypa]